MKVDQMGWTSPASIIAGMASGTMMVISAMFSYWFFFDTNPPLTVQYRALKFSAVPVDNREDLKKFALDVVPAGATVYLYEESCRSRNTSGKVTRVFTGDFVFSLPVINTTSVVGCANRSYAVKIPPAPGDYEYIVRIEYDNNPISTSIYRYEAMPVRVK